MIATRPAALRASKLVPAHTAARKMPDPTIVPLRALWAGIRGQPLAS